MLIQECTCKSGWGEPVFLPNTSFDKTKLGLQLEEWQLAHPHSQVFHQQVEPTTFSQVQVSFLLKITFCYLPTTQDWRALQRTGCTRQDWLRTGQDWIGNRQDWLCVAEDQRCTGQDWRALQRTGCTRHVYKTGGALDMTDGALDRTGGACRGLTLLHTGLAVQ